MAGLSTAESDAYINFRFRSGTLPKIATLYVALHTSDPTDAALATELAIGTAGYARSAIAALDTNFSPPTTVAGKRQTGNAVNIAFGLPTANWASGANITHASIWDAATGGTMLMSGALAVPRTVLSSDNSPTFGPGAILFAID
jgi:hypothetical protein